MMSLGARAINGIRNKSKTTTKSYEQVDQSFGYCDGDNDIDNN